MTSSKLSRASFLPSWQPGARTIMKLAARRAKGVSLEGASREFS